MSEVVTGLNSGASITCIPSGCSRGELVSLPFLDSRVCPHDLTHGPPSTFKARNEASSNLPLTSTLAFILISPSLTLTLLSLSLSDKRPCDYNEHQTPIIQNNLISKSLV